MHLKKVHRAIQFEQDHWMEPYIRMNTEIRNKAKSDFQSNFYKLMNNKVRQKDGESEKQHQCEDRLKLGDRQDTPPGGLTFHCVG